MKSEQRFLTGEEDEHQKTKLLHTQPPGTDTRPAAPPFSAITIGTGVSRERSRQGTKGTPCGENK